MTTFKDMIGRVRSEIREISPADARARAKDAVVIDVREADEVATGMPPGARHLPLAALLGDVDAVAAELAGSEVVVVCQVGMRARRAAQALRGAGVDAVVLRGGMDGYISRRQPA
jgi:adenylyltransferase/sulfurtransferase